MPSNFSGLHVGGSSQEIAHFFWQVVVNSVGRVVGVLFLSTPPKGGTHYTTTSNNKKIFRTLEVTHGYLKKLAYQKFQPPQIISA